MLLSISTFSNLRAKAKEKFDFEKVRKSNLESIRQFKIYESQSRNILCFDFLSKAKVFEGEMDNPNIYVYILIEIVCHYCINLK